jgi:hypothetical protein
MADRFPFARRRGSADVLERPLDLFVRGLLSGAVVGAVVAGSAIWGRRSRRRKAAEAGEPAEAAVEGDVPGAAATFGDTAAG